MALSTFALLCNNHRHPSPELFRHPKLAAHVLNHDSVLPCGSFVEKSKHQQHDNLAQEALMAALGLNASSAVC